MVDLKYGVDVIEGLRQIPDESVHCVVTSPPYWGLRDYGVDGQIGLERTPEEFIQKLVEVFREVRRVLRSDGTAWVNMGDGYASAGNGPQGDKGQCKRPKNTKKAEYEQRRSTITAGFKPKDLIGQPWMLAFALRADGWYLRSDIIWSKPNPMPESVTDRPTKAHEYIFLLTRSDKYFYDAEAIREDASEAQSGRISQKRGEFSGKSEAMEGRNAFRAIVEKRNKRTVWEIATEPYPEAHFATFPTELVKPCILAGTSAHGVCAECGGPWKREVNKTRTFESGSGRSGNMPAGKNGAHLQGGGETKDIRRGPCISTETIGWTPTCKHKADRIPATVLDPFSGSATTGYVALGLGRSYIGIDLNKKYLELAKKRLGLFAMGA